LEKLDFGLSNFKQNFNFVNVNFVNEFNFALFPTSKARFRSTNLKQNVNNVNVNEINKMVFEIKIWIKEERAVVLQTALSLWDFDKL